MTLQSLIFHLGRAKTADGTDTDTDTDTDTGTGTETHTGSTDAALCKSGHGDGYCHEPGFAVRLPHS